MVARGELQSKKGENIWGPSSIINSLLILILMDIYDKRGLERSGCIHLVPSLLLWAYVLYSYI